MKTIILSYEHHPTTAGIYFERALSNDRVLWLGPQSDSRVGFVANLDVNKLIGSGWPKPDLIIFMEPYNRFLPYGLDSIECPTALYSIDVHRNAADRVRFAPFFDYIFVSQRDYVSYFQHHGHKHVKWLPLACDPQIHAIPRSEPIWDIGFVGNLNSDARQRRLDMLAAEFTVNNYHQSYAMSEIAEVYSRSKIVFNSSIGGEVNMRVFEALASGALLLTDRIENGMSELFEPGVHFVEYGDDQELVAKAHYYLSHDAERTKIAQQGQQLVLAKHTYKSRLDTIADTIWGEAKGELCAPIRASTPAAVHRMYTQMYCRLGCLDALADELLWAHRNHQGRIRTLLHFTKAILRSVKRCYHN